MINSGMLEIRLVGDDQLVAQVEIPGVEGYTLGRTDSTSTFLPDIDFADYGGRDKGVSRRHAALVRFRGMVHVVDLDSVNGTFLNGERLLPHVPYPLNSGDQLSIANLSLTITQGNT